MTDRELLEYVAAQVGKLSNDVNEIKNDVSSLKEGQKKLENITTYIEQDHGKKLDALFDGYKQNASKLDRIEAEVTKQEEIIMRRIK